MGGADAVSVTLDGAGKVCAVQVTADWRRRVGDPQSLGGAVLEAVQAAALARLSAWGEAFSDDSPEDSPAAPPGDVTDQPQDFAAPRQTTSEDVRTGLVELLGMAEDLERGIDELSEQLPIVAAATHRGSSADGCVAVTVTGGGEVREIHYDRAWLGRAHEASIGRHTQLAFAAAYEAAARSGVEQFIANSRLGELQRAMQDPLGYARRSGRSS